jgi:hypothetical protein
MQKEQGSVLSLFFDQFMPCVIKNFMVFDGQVSVATDGSTRSTIGDEVRGVCSVTA